MASLAAALIKWYKLFPRPDTDDASELRKHKVMTLVKCAVVNRLSVEDAAPAAIDGLPRLFLGSLGAAVNRDGLRELGVTHVLCAAGGINPLYPDDFTYKVLPLLDAPGQDLLEYFDSAIAFIEAAVAGGGAVLVHCFAGKSRSTSMVVAYMMQTKRMSLKQCLSIIRRTRPIAEPNAGFAAQLLIWQRKQGIVVTAEDERLVEAATKALLEGRGFAGQKDEDVDAGAFAGAAASAGATDGGSSTGGAGGGAVGAASGGR